MRKLIATVFNYSVDGLLADQDTEFWKFCFDLPENRDPDDPEQLDFLRNAHFCSDPCMLCSPIRMPTLLLLSPLPLLVRPPPGILACCGGGALASSATR